MLDGTAGLWCCNAGHGRREISEAVSKPDRQDGFRSDLPDGPSGRPSISAATLAAISRRGSRKLDRVFFTNSGSESVDTALKIALAYQRAIGQGTPYPPDRP
ncbi:MAG: aminotransferase class III-fold pyridoxal phosphate-dependent enzyme [Stutzerimonas stutzeri]